MASGYLRGIINNYAQWVSTLCGENIDKDFEKQSHKRKKGQRQSYAKAQPCLLVRGKWQKAEVKVEAGELIFVKA